MNGQIKCDYIYTHIHIYTVGYYLAIKGKSCQDLQWQGSICTAGYYAKYNKPDQKYISQYMSSWGSNVQQGDYSK